MTKICTRCDEEKPLDDYFKDSRDKHGRYAKCKPCHNEVVKISENKPNAKEKRASRLASQREHINERQRRYYAEHRETLRMYYSEWIKQHPEISLAKTHRRRTRILNAEGSFTANEWVSLCERYSFKCLSCGANKLSVDHVVPLSRGGSNSIDNIQPLCVSCNSKKGTKIIDYRGTTDKCEIKF